MIHTLETDGICLEFGNRRILSDIYLKCETGKITGLLGRNGEGKSCLMKIIYSTLAVDNGSVRFDRQYNMKLGNTPGHLRYLPQFNFIPGHLTLERVFSDFDVALEDFEEIFPEFRGRRMTGLKNLSGGGRRLVEVYLILRSKTKFVMLNEPFTHLMPLQIEKVKELILLEKANKGILISDHMFRHVIDICDALYVLTGGKTHLTRQRSDLKDLGYINGD